MAFALTRTVVTPPPQPLHGRDAAIVSVLRGNATIALASG
jgi:hypothetical protein